VELRRIGTVALVIGAGQTPGASVGNGRAAAIQYAREGAQVVAADVDPASAKETADLILAEGGDAFAATVNVTIESDIATAVEACCERGGLGIMHNNVRVGILGGEIPGTDIDAQVFSRLMAVNLPGMVLAAKHAIPVMASRAGVSSSTSRPTPC